MSIIDMIEDMAQNGHAPDEGCGLFGVGNDDAINRIQETYMKKRFSRGGSVEKFVVGPFGSGKTHFINHLLEAARNQNCVTAKVSLNKNVDVTSNYQIFKELTQDIRAPGSKKGMKNLLLSCTEKVKNDAFEKEQSEKVASEFLQFWVSGLEDFDFEYDVFGRVVKQAFDAHLKRNDEKFEFAFRWISGEFNNREINKMLNLSRISKNEQNLVAKRVGLSLYQLIKRAGFTGTVVAFDEAEQGFSISSKKKSQLRSLLQSDINSINELSNGSVLVIYAITPDIKEEMMELAALQQRIQNPLEKMGFWEGNTRAPLIELTRPEKYTAADELAEIGKRLIDLFYSDEGVKTEVTIPKEEVISKIKAYAVEVSNKDRSLSDRRDMVRVTCSTLIYLYDNDKLIDFDFSQLNEEENDFDDEG